MIIPNIIVLLLTYLVSNLMINPNTVVVITILGKSSYDNS